MYVDKGRGAGDYRNIENTSPEALADQYVQLKMVNMDFLNKFTQMHDIARCLVSGFSINEQL